MTTHSSLLDDFVETGNLREAFQQFTESSALLEKSYLLLQEKFYQMDQQLKVANLQLREKIQQLNATSSHLDNILRYMTQGILFISLEGIITTYNCAAENFFHIPQEQVISHSFWENFQDTFFGFSMRKSLQEKVAPQLSYVDMDNSLQAPHTYEISGSFLCKETDVEQEGMILVVRDISEIRRLQILTNRNSRMKELGEMAAAVAHEIRNPLGGIKGFASLLQKDLEGDGEKKKMVENIMQGVDTLDLLVNRVLQYTRPLTLHRKRIDILPLLKEVFALISADERNRKIQFSFSIDENSLSTLTLPVDRELLRSVIFNLIMNAVQAFSEKKRGKVALCVTEEEGWGVITISDNGMGIPSENREKIFSPFFTTKSDGNGLGLSEVHKIVRAHGGEVTFVSHAEKGTMFTIRLPMHSSIQIRK